MEDGDIFNFVIGGTAYRRDLVAATGFNRDESFTTESTRFFGTPNQAFYGASKITLRKIIFPLNVKHNEVSFIEQGYTFSIVYTPEFHSDIPSKINLPLSI